MAFNDPPNKPCAKIREYAKYLAAYSACSFELFQIYIMRVHMMGNSKEENRVEGKKEREREMVMGITILGSL